MTRRPEGATLPEYRTRLPQAFTPVMRQYASLIGAGPMTKDELKTFRDGLYAQFGRGLKDDRSGEPRIQAIKSRVQPVTQEQWQRATAGDPILLAEAGGTNNTLRAFRKINDAEVDISDLLEPTIVVPREERASSWNRFIRRIAEPIGRQAAILGRDGRPVSIALSLGQPNANIVSPNGIDAVLLPHTVGSDGAALLSNSYAIEDWSRIQDRRVMRAIAMQIDELNPDVNLGALVALNDTIGNGQYSALNAAIFSEQHKVQEEPQAQEEKVIFHPSGNVFGTGDNQTPYMEAGYYPAVDYTMLPEDAGYVNSEDGNAEVKNNPVSQRARRILIDRGLLKQADDKPILERRTGEHMTARLAAGVELFAEKDLIDIPNPTAVTNALLAEAEKNPALISDIAVGKFPPIVLGEDAKQIIQALAQGLQEQTAQIYGEQLAFVTNVSNSPLPDDDTTIITGVEGSAFNLGVVGPDLEDEDKVLTTKVYAEAVSADQGRRLTAIPSSGTTGIAVAAAVNAAA